MEAEQSKKDCAGNLDIFAPLANRLGIYKIKGRNFEDLSLRYLEPEKYYEIRSACCSN